MAETTLELDAKAWALLMALQADGRAPLKTLAMAAGLSVPATVERLKRLKDAGVVRAVSADVDPALAGYPVRAIVGITVQQPGKKAFIPRRMPWSDIVVSALRLATWPRACTPASVREAPAMAASSRCVSFASNTTTALGPTQ